MDHDDKVTDEDIDRQFHLLRTDPAKFLELTDQFAAQNPADPNAYFNRHFGGKTQSMSWHWKI